MRNAAELIAAATATGTYTNYVGDGASVPWQVGWNVNTYLGISMWVYKKYLDYRWPHAFKLHDWCYTPYSIAINCTREEADDALYELIAVDSVFDATIVHASVQQFGGPFFQRSQTGYRGPQAELVAGNIGSASHPDRTLLNSGQLTFNTIGEALMANQKAILKFNGNTGGGTPQPSIGYTGASHAFGFSESVWRTGFTVAQMTAYLKNTLGPARAALLPSNAKLTSATIYDSAGGKGIDVPLGYTGQYAATDQVNVGILCETRSTLAAAQRRWWVHCMPDDLIKDGEFKPGFFDAQAFQTYLGAIGQGSWLGVDQNDLSSIVTIDATGLVTLTANQPWGVGSQLRVTRTTDSTGVRRGGNFMVASVGPLATQFTLTDWPYGKTTGGKVYRPTYSYYSIGGGDGPYVVRVGTRRVGRPFSLYRGRQPARR